MVTCVHAFEYLVVKAESTLPPRGYHAFEYRVVKAKPTLPPLGYMHLNIALFTVHSDYGEPCRKIKLGY